MKILDKFGLGRKNKGVSPIIKDSKSKASRSFSLKDSYLVKGIIFALFLAFVIVVFPRTSYKLSNYKIGEPWRQEDLTAPFTFSLLKSKDELKKEKDQIKQNTPPIFHVKHQAGMRMESELDSLFNSFSPALKQYLQWKTAPPNTAQATSDSLEFINSLNAVGTTLDDNAWTTLLQSYLSANASTKVLKRYDLQPQKQFIGVKIKNRISSIIKKLTSDGIINVDKSTLSNNEITVRDLKNRTERSDYLANVRDLSEAKEYASYQLSKDFTEKVAETATQIFNKVVEPNLIYNKKETEARIADALSKISPTKGAVTKGQVIIRKGDLINARKLNMIKSLAQARSERVSQLEVWQQYLGEILTIIAIVLVFYMYIYLYRKSIFDNNAMFLLVYMAIAFIIGASAVVSHFSFISPYVVPIAIIPIILTIIFDSRVGLLTTLILALLTGMMIGYDFEFVVATITACSMAVYSMRDIKNRSQFFFFTPAIVFITYVLVFAGFSLSKLGDIQTFAHHVLASVVNAILIWLTYPLILLVEKLFKVTTDVTLLELSDTNQPLLKDLMMRAPGTFHHSLQVANLAETAANAIGANAILCRVGALYHDIGKMEKPEYFVENQSGVNEHDKLKPRMSAIVIKTHVSNGVKMGQKEQLPDIIIDFIRTHHGTSIIKYFYEKAKESTENTSEIQVEDFRYDGPLPNTKETGVVMLADGVEASSRAMTDPNYQKLDNLVNRIVDERLNEGQLNNCPLTFKDLQKIKDTFLNILVGMYHGRVKYPGQDEKDNAADKQDKSDKPKTVMLHDAPPKDRHNSKDSD
ncbi:MAG TPA: HDIG domain-containing protein [Balneolales bacterium]|nr:HDIG domain-containing protein [Balneolales bacterium]